MTHNSTSIIGNLGRDPELKYSQNGNAFTTFSVATQYKYGEVEETTWWNVITFGKQAESCNKYLSKGSLVFVEGRVREPKVFQTKDGTFKANLELTANVVRFLGGIKDKDREDTEF